LPRVFPEVSLSKAREKRDAARKMLDAGNDPAAVKREHKRLTVEKSEQTFERIAHEWHKKGSFAWSSGYAKKILDSLEQNVFPTMFILGTKEGGHVGTVLRFTKEPVKKVDLDTIKEAIPRGHTIKNILSLT
jgi:hypothetical protein